MTDEHSREDPPEALPVEELQHRRLTCWYCGSEDLVKGLELGLTTESGAVGIKFHSTEKFLGRAQQGKEPLRVTLCAACGTVVRLSVKVTDRDWV